MNSRGITGMGAGSPGSSGFVISGVTMTIKFGLVLALLAALEQCSEQRNAGQSPGILLSVS